MAKRSGPAAKSGDKIGSTPAQALEVVDGMKIQAPDPREEWLPATVAAWRSYWRSDAALLLMESDLPSVLRMFDLHDRVDTLRECMADTDYWTAEGSTGQQVISCFVKMEQLWSKEMLELGDRFGTNPMARQRLNVRKSGRREPTLLERMRADAGLGPQLMQPADDLDAKGRMKVTDSQASPKGTHTDDK